MNNLKPRDQINKASWLLVEAIKDSVTANLAAAVQTKKLDVNNEQLSMLLNVVNASIEAGYHRANREFVRSADKAIESAVDDAVAVVTKKKSPRF